MRKHTPFKPDKDAAGTQVASQGLASFYSEGGRTASGEKFNANELTAAHPTLPFGTRLRVVDVSSSAADALGMVSKGVAKVRLDVVQ